MSFSKAKTGFGRARFCSPALAKGHQAGVGQALIKLDASPADIVACPIGHAAYVDFPGVGLLDVMRARLRL